MIYKSLFGSFEADLSLLSAPPALSWRSICNMGKEWYLLLESSPLFWSNTTHLLGEERQDLSPPWPAEVSPETNWLSHCTHLSGKRGKNVKVHYTLCPWQSGKISIPLGQSKCNICSKNIFLLMLSTVNKICQSLSSVYVKTKTTQTPPTLPYWFLYSHHLKCLCMATLKKIWMKNNGKHCLTLIANDLIWLLYSRVFSRKEKKKKILREK